LNLCISKSPNDSQSSLSNKSKACAIVLNSLDVRTPTVFGGCAAKNTVTKYVTNLFGCETSQEVSVVAPPTTAHVLHHFVQTLKQQTARLVSCDILDLVQSR
jgi:hypothetical protein